MNDGRTSRLVCPCGQVFENVPTPGQEVLNARTGKIDQVVALSVTLEHDRADLLGDAHLVLRLWFRDEHGPTDLQSWHPLRYLILEN